MDKKSFLFILLLTFSFFFVNNFLFDRAPKVKETPISSITSDLNALPLVALYDDKEESSSIGYGIYTHGIYFTDYTEDLPKTLYAKGKKLTQGFPPQKGAPVCYLESLESKIPLRIASKTAAIELKFIENLVGNTHVTYSSASYDNSEVTFLEKAPQKNAVAVYRSKESWIPYGYWSDETKTFTYLADSPLYQDILQISTSDIFEKEKLYVLENEYAQLVFSTIGGAIKEVNLPFESQKDHESIIRPIYFDKVIAARYPTNDYFPLGSYYSVDAQGETTLTAPKLGGYTPLLRRNLKDEDDKVSFAIPPIYYLATLVTEELDQQSTFFSVTKFTKDEIELVGKQPLRTITKNFRFVKDAPYVIELTVTIDGDLGDLWLSSGLPEVELISGNFSPILHYYAQKGKKLKLEKLSLPKQDEVIPQVTPLWVSNSNGFFGIILGHSGENGAGIRIDRMTGDSAPSRISLIDRDYDLYPAKDYPTCSIQIPFKPVKSKTMTFQIYAGPFSESVMKQADIALSKTLKEGNPHFSKALTLQGWFTFISEPFAAFLYIIMKFFFFITRSWGISIILLTLVLRLLLYPLNTWSFKSNLKMQKLGPKVKALQDKYKGDTKRLQMETAMLYKTEGVNPFSGCLPILIQIPFLIGMFDLLKSTFALRGASFIPGWIDNLTAPDVLFSWSYPIIFFGTSFHLLPLILSVLMYLQQKMNSLSQDKKAPLTDQQKQMKSMGNMMSVIFFFFFYNMPSGLNIYWIFSTIFGMLQQWLFMSRLMVKNKGSHSSKS